MCHSPYLPLKKKKKLTYFPIPNKKFIPKGHKVEQKVIIKLAKGFLPLFAKLQEGRRREGSKDWEGGETGRFIL